MNGNRVASLSILLAVGTKDVIVEDAEGAEGMGVSEVRKLEFGRELSWVLLRALLWIWMRFAMSLSLSRSLCILSSCSDTSSCGSASSGPGSS